MFTNKINNNSNNSMSSTKVICSNCGAEIVIPAHEEHVSGVAIGKDSGLGTVVLPTEKCSHSQPSLNDALAVVAASLGVSTTKSNGNAIELISDLIMKIQDQGYVEVKDIVRRWVPSQCVAMLEDHRGFHRALLDRGIDYSWSVLVADLKCQAKMFHAGDSEGLRDRNRWYNQEIALAMAKDYLFRLQDKIAHMPTHRHKGRKYVKLDCNMNLGRGIHLDELSVLYGKISKAIEKIHNASNPIALSVVVEGFDDLRRQIRTNISMCPAFMNAYKAAGAYYTMKDFILFEGFKLMVNGKGDTGCRLCSMTDKRRFVEQKESLAVLEIQASKLVAEGVGEYGYMLLGLLKEFLSYNHFSYKETTEKWARQSEARRLMRAANINRRSRK